MTSTNSQERRTRHATRRLLRAVASAALLTGATLARAGVDCVVSTAGVAFGTYDPLLTTGDATVGTITVTCNYVAPGGNATATYTLALSAGGSANVTQRQLFAGSNRLGYNLYKDAARSQVLGTGSAGTFTITGSLTVGSGTGNTSRSQSYSIYGLIPAQQDVGAGAYGDAIVATLTY